MLVGCLIISSNVAQSFYVMNVAQWKREWVLLVQESGEFLRTYVPHATDNMLLNSMLAPTVMTFAALLQRLRTLASCLKPSKKNIIMPTYKDVTETSMFVN